MDERLQRPYQGFRSSSIFHCVADESVVAFASGRGFVAAVVAAVEAPNYFASATTFASE